MPFPGISIHQDFQVHSLLVTIRDNDQNFSLFTGLNIGACCFVKPQREDLILLACTIFIVINHILSL